MRYVIYGAGAVGGTIGWRLFDAGMDVVLIARGPHLEHMRREGLRLTTPDSDAVRKIPVAGDPVEAAVGPGDVVLLTVKSQDTTAALDALTAAGITGVPVVCAQNGVENERAALRRFPDVYALCVVLPAVHLEPGRIEAFGMPHNGILDVGRYPAGTDDTATTIAADLERAGFSSRADAAVMRMKYRKLVKNTANALDALGGTAARQSELADLVHRESEAVLAAAGIDVASDAEDKARRAGVMQAQPIAGRKAAGNSSWQSLSRGTGSIESDYLNGEITLTARLAGAHAPVNAALQAAAARFTRQGLPAGSLSVDELRALLLSVPG